MHPSLHDSHRCCRAVSRRCDYNLWNHLYRSFTHSHTKYKQDPPLCCGGCVESVVGHPSSNYGVNGPAHRPWLQLPGCANTGEVRGIAGEGREGAQDESLSRTPSDNNPWIRELTTTASGDVIRSWACTAISQAYDRERKWEGRQAAPNMPACIAKRKVK